MCGHMKEGRLGKMRLGVNEWIWGNWLDAMIAEWRLLVIHLRCVRGEIVSDGTHEG